MEQLKNKKGFICDMDGVIYHGNVLLPGVKEFVEWLQREDKEYLFLTNASGKTPLELQMKLSRMGLNVDKEHFYTSALATASFLKSQCPGGSVYVIGEPGLVNALYDAGLSMNDYNPDYVVFGETRSISYEKIEQEYARMRSTLRQKIEDISENRAELMSNLNSLKASDRYAQILELSELLSLELYKEREKAMAKEREEKLQMRLELSESKEAELKTESARPPISPDRTAVKIDQDSKKGLDIEIMDRSNEVVDKNERD